PGFFGSVNHSFAALEQPQERQRREGEHEPDHNRVSDDRPEPAGSVQRHETGARSRLLTRAGLRGGTGTGPGLAPALRHVAHRLTSLRRRPRPSPHGPLGGHGPSTLKFSSFRPWRAMLSIRALGTPRSTPPP